MTPEIRAAVKALAAAFQAILEALAREDAPAPPKPTPPSPSPGHQAHLVVNRRDGFLDFCCDRHAEAFEATVARYGPPPQAVDALSGPQRRYIQERFGGNPRDFPGPRW
jgi:hypothetical protein